MDIEVLTTGVRERDVTGALVLFPVPHEEDDDVRYAHLAMFIDPEMVGPSNHAVFLISGKPGSDQYTVLDLNKLPLDVEVEVIVRTNVSESRTSFRGQNGNMPQPPLPVGE